MTKASQSDKFGPNILIRFLPKEAHEALKIQAAELGTSMNQYLVRLITEDTAETRTLIAKESERLSSADSVVDGGGR